MNRPYGISLEDYFRSKTKKDDNQDAVIKRKIEDFIITVKNLKKRIEQLSSHNKQFFEILKDSAIIFIKTASAKEKNITQDQIEDPDNTIDKRCKRDGTDLFNCACSHQLKKVVVVMEYEIPNCFTYIIGKDCIKNIDILLYMLQCGDEVTKKLLREVDNIDSYMDEEAKIKLYKNFNKIYKKVDTAVKEKDKQECIICNRKVINIKDVSNPHKPPDNDLRRLDICKNCIIDNNTYKCINRGNDYCLGFVNHNRHNARRRWREKLRCDRCSGVKSYVKKDFNFHNI